MNVLEQIVATKQQELAARRAARPLAELLAAARDLPRPRNFYSALSCDPPDGVHLVAEIKKASPSAGLIREDFDPVQIARIYHANGASALSVLTDETYFAGRLEFIEQVRSAVPLPVLRKDFLIDEYQLYESRCAQADAVLLIAELLTPQKLLDMLILANELKMTTVIEVHEADVLLRFRSVVGFPLRHYSLIGINNRNLKDQTVDLSTTPRLLSLLDGDELVISESGVQTRHDVLRLQKAGARAILVGEACMRSPDIGAKLRELLGRS